MNMGQGSIMASESIEIIVTETGGVARNREYVRVGIPCAKGDVIDSEGILLLSPSDEAQPVQSTILKKWNDGSIKWQLLDFAATVPAHKKVVYRLVKLNGLAPVVLNPVNITKSSEYWQVSTGTTKFIVDAKEFRPFRSIMVNDNELLAHGGSSCLFGLGGRNLTPIVDSIVAESEGQIRSTIRLEGRFDYDQSTSPRFICRMHFFAGSSQLHLEFTLLNSQAASHPGGLWDLGDSGSLLFRELALHFPLIGFGSSRIICSPESTLSSLQFEKSPGGMRIFQESSGGENWNSPVHRTRDGNVHLRFEGYEIRDRGEKVAGGKRATPVVWCGDGDTGVSAVMPRFWQEFPKAFALDTDGLKVELFPDCSSDLHELQGGEQKTSSIYLDFAASPQGLVWARSPLVVVPSPETCHNSGVFSDLPPMQGQAKVADLVDKFITPDDLLNKREVVDEYGWRNFGDFYADHEAVYHKGTVPFVSHYNNQYDGIGGAYRKFFATGDAQWGELASDLARHVLDIDIYHTDYDREEYNRGLFWHTNHYVDAGLSGHRSFSREHLKGKDPRLFGGGPGAEHCYTTGLMIHYFQTGDPAFRDAVISLTDWVICSLAGPFTILAAMKRGARYFSRLRRHDGSARPLFPRYPLTRGTGNTITACLDAYEVGGGTRFLEKAEELIFGSLHPEDDINARDLLNPEIAWSYTVLLVAVAKYLDKKRELDQFDAGYAYARASLLAYAEWMLRYEYPYLEKPEILEYPNETWAVQELRKSVVFYHAARHAPPDRHKDFVERGRYFFAAAAAELSRHESSSFTRPVTLMLQNGWVGNRFDHDIPLVLPDRVPVPVGSPTPLLQIGPVVSRIAGDLLNAARVTSLKREMAWLKARLG